MIAIIPKADLVHGAYYQGRCRNATMARWNAEKQCFTHWRTKFSSVFLEDIKHPDDEQRFDVFYPYVLISVPEQEIPFDALTRMEAVQLRIAEKAKPPNSFEHAKANANPDCPKCKGIGAFMYDHNHSTICNLCCKHDRGYWQLLEHYGADNGKWCCIAGCGHKLDTEPKES